MNDESLFRQAIERPPQTRSEFLVGACGDDDQRSRLEALVAAHQRDDSLLDTASEMNSDPGSVDPGLPDELGDFEILSELGRGGMGVVYKARQKSLNRIVALKVLSSGLGLSSRAILRFRREAEAAGKLHHTNIVPVYTTGEDRGIHYYAMEWIDGPSLDRVVKDLRQAENATAKHDCESVSDVPDWLRKTALYATAESGEVSTRETTSSASSVAQGSKYFDHVATMIADVAEALDHAHEHGVVHRDIKPSNLLLAPDGRLSINDFGLARMLEQPGMTMTGEFVGSPLYMSPEQITAGRAPLDHRTDIYSLGATLYELLTHQPPFPGDTRDQVISQVMHKEARSPRHLNRKVPLDLDTICMKAIEKDPDCRYQTAEHFAKDLRAYVNRHAISIRRVGPIGTAVKFVRRNLLASSFVAVVVLLLTIGGILLYGQQRAFQESRRSSAMALTLLHSLNQNFPAAQEQIQIARDSGADAGWCLMAEAQISVFQADYEIAQGKLSKARDAGAPKIPTTSLMAISMLIAGDEMSHLDELVDLSDDMEDKLLVPAAPQDHLYLALAFMWADPKRALDYLEIASDQEVSGDAVKIIRSAASGHYALDQINPEKGLEFALDAVTAADAVKSDGNPFNLARLIQARTITATFAGMIGDETLKRQMIDKAESELLPVKTSSNPDLNHSIYCLFLQTDREEQAFKFLMGLDDAAMDDYARAYRILAQIRLGERERAQQDFQAIENDAEYRQPLLTMVELANATNADQFRELSFKFDKFLRGRFTQENELHLGLNWAASRLLKMQRNEERCMQRMERIAIKYESTYMDQLYAPMRRLARGEDPQLIEQEARKQSRKQLTFALFALGVDALSRGDEATARSYFEKCVSEGWYRFYVCHTARGLLAKMNTDPTWAARIAAIPEWNKASTEVDDESR